MDKTTLAFLVAVGFALIIIKFKEWLEGRDDNLTEDGIV